MKIFIVLSESPLKVRKIAVYRFLISVLVLELLTLKGPPPPANSETKEAKNDDTLHSYSLL